MSRLLLIASLVTAFTSVASADRIEAPRFAKPPAAATAIDAERDAVIDQLARNRSANLARFRSYQRDAVFPNNTYSPGKLNVWRDGEGHLCAAATIIRASGKVALVDEIARTQNFIRLGDVRGGAVMDWILTSGFTQDEIAMIQEPFEGVVDGEQEPGPGRARISQPLRGAEDVRLSAIYRRVEVALIKNERASLAAAADRLLQQHAGLAARLLAAR
jgi:hypothetical protein